MKVLKLLAILLVPGLLLFTSCNKEETMTKSTVSTLKAGGNGLDVNGPHFNLNIIGVPKGKSADMTTGHRIFVPLWGKCNIWLQEGEFEVIDGNGTDGSAAFQLPNPDPDGDGVTAYSVYIRALGKPGGKATMYTCAYDALGDLYCSDPDWWVNLVRDKGKSTFQNVTKELLFVSTDIDGDGNVEHVALFSEELQDYFWYYDNKGLKLAQMRFYEIPYDTGW